MRGWMMRGWMVMVCAAAVLGCAGPCWGADGGRQWPTEAEATAELLDKYGARDGNATPLWDGTRVDMETEHYVIEVDWAVEKWKEAIGQALYYSVVTGKQPGIILLVKDMERARRHIYRCQTVCARYGIRLWVETVPITPPDAPTLAPPEPQIRLHVRPGMRSREASDGQVMLAGARRARS